MIEIIVNQRPKKSFYQVREQLESIAKELPENIVDGRFLNSFNRFINKTCYLCNSRLTDKEETVHIKFIYQENSSLLKLKQSNTDFYIHRYCIGYILK